MAYPLIKITNNEIKNYSIEKVSASGKNPLMQINFSGQNKLINYYHF